MSSHSQLEKFAWQAYFLPGGDFCLQDLTIKKKTTHTIVYCSAWHQRSALGTQWFSNSSSFLIPPCISADTEFYFKAAKCKIRDNGQKSCELSSNRNICPADGGKPLLSNSSDVYGSFRMCI